MQGTHWQINVQTLTMFVHLLLFSDMGRSPPPPRTHWSALQPMAASADQMLIGCCLSSIFVEASFCRTGCWTQWPNVGWFTLNWRNLAPCVPAFRVKAGTGVASYWHQILDFLLVMCLFLYKSWLLKMTKFVFFSVSKLPGSIQIYVFICCSWHIYWLCCILVKCDFPHVLGHSNKNIEGSHIFIFLCTMSNKTRLYVFFFFLIKVLLNWGLSTYNKLFHSSDIRH